MLENFTILNNHNKAKVNDNLFEDIKIIETEEEKKFLHFLEKGLVSTELSVQKQKVSDERCFKHRGLWNDTVISHWSVLYIPESTIIAGVIQTTDKRNVQPDTSGCVIEPSSLPPIVGANLCWPFKVSL